jgi:hypothetical protein
MNTCKNCGSELNGKYCSNCGQEDISTRLTVGHIFKDATHGILHWESSILKTFKELILRPGKFLRIYLDGKRKPFVKPFSYFIFIQTVYVIIFHWMSDKYFAFIAASVTVNGEISKTQMNKFEETKHLVTSNINYLNYIFPLIVAVFWRLFLKKKTGINYAESLVSSLYLVGTTLFFGLILMLLSALLPRIWEARFAVNLLYIIIAVIQFSGYKKFKASLRGLAITFISYIVYIIVVSGLTLFYIFVIKGVNLESFKPPGP